MSDYALIEAMAVHMTSHLAVGYRDAKLYALYALAVARPIIEAPLLERLDAFEMDGASCANEVKRLRAENEKLRAERDLWISRFEDFRKNAARLEEARSRPMRLVGSAAAAALKETGDEA